MPIKSPFLLAIAALMMASTAIAECTQPEPPTIPDGATASQEQMVEGQQAVRQYLQEGNSYLECLKQKEQATAKAAEKANVDPDSEEAAAFKQEMSAILKEHNAAVDKMQDVGNRFNAEVKRYKAAASAGQSKANP